MTHPNPRRMRSRAVPTVLLGLAALALAGCEEDPQVQAQAFPTLAACLDEADEVAASISAQDCRLAFEAAEDAWAESAPRYAEQALCEEEHGGECVAEQRDGGSVFMPILTGYLLGRAISGDSRPLMSQPLIPIKGGGFATPGGDTRVSSNSGSADLRASSFRAAPSTRLAAPMTRATVASRGGFGATRTAIGGRGAGG